MIGSKLTSKGQTTIPKEIRAYLGLKPGDRIVFIPKDGKVSVESLKETLLDLRGSVNARRHPEDFDQVRQQVKHRMAPKVKNE